MKTGKTLSELSAEIIRQASTKKDFIAPAKLMHMQNAMLDIGGQRHVGSFQKVNDYAHWQLATWLGIPKPYYEKMLRVAPDLLSANVNEWMSMSDEKKMVRTLDGNVRAVLSDRYRPLDNFDLAEQVIPALSNHGAYIESCEVTEKRLYLKAVRHDSKGLEVSVGDVVKSGIVISNSEIGAGSLKIEPMIFRLVCKNGAISSTTLRKYHSGRRATELGDYFANDTVRATDRAFWMQVRDMCRSAMQDLFLQEWVKSAQSSMADAIEKPATVVELSLKPLGLNESEGEGIISLLVISLATDLRMRLLVMRRTLKTMIAQRSLNASDRL